MIKQKMTYFFVIAVYFITTAAAFAQDEFPEDEGPEGPPAAPVNNYLLLLAVIGIALAWKAFTKAGSSSEAQHLNA